VLKSRKGVQLLGLGNYVDSVLEDIMSLESLCGEVLAGLNVVSMEEASCLLMKLHYGCHLPDIVPLVEAFVPAGP